MRQIYYHHSHEKLSVRSELQKVTIVTGPIMRVGARMMAELGSTRDIPPPLALDQSIKNIIHHLRNTFPYPIPAI